MIIIILILVLSPRAQPGQSGIVIPPNADPIYSTYTVGLVLMTVTMFLGLLLALFALGRNTLLKVTHARVID